MKRVIITALSILAALTLFGFYYQFPGGHTEGRTSAALRNLASALANDAELLRLINGRWPSATEIDYDEFLSFLSSEGVKGKGGGHLLASLPQWRDRIAHDYWGRALQFAIVPKTSVQGFRNELAIWSLGQNHLDEKGTNDDLVISVVLPLVHQ